jgi:hypothetical protein
MSHFKNFVHSCNILIYSFDSCSTILYFLTFHYDFIFIKMSIEQFVEHTYDEKESYRVIE